MDLWKCLIATLSYLKVRVKEPIQGPHALSFHSRKTSELKSSISQERLILMNRTSVILKTNFLRITASKYAEYCHQLLRNIKYVVISKD